MLKINKIVRNVVHVFSRCIMEARIEWKKNESCPLFLLRAAKYKEVENRIKHHSQMMKERRKRLIGIPQEDMERALQDLETVSSFFSLGHAAVICMFLLISLISSPVKIIGYTKCLCYLLMVALQEFLARSLSFCNIIKISKKLKLQAKKNVFAA